MYLEFKDQLPFIGFFFLFNFRYLRKNTAHSNSNYFDLTTVVQSQKIPVINLYISRMFLNYFESQGAIFFLGYLKLKISSLKHISSLGLEREQREKVVRKQQILDENKVGGSFFWRLFEIEGLFFVLIGSWVCGRWCFILCVLWVGHFCRSIFLQLL